MSDCAGIEGWIVDYLEDSLEADRCEQLESHLVACEECRDAVEAYRSILVAYCDTPQADVSDSVAERILARAAAANSAPWSRVLPLLAAAAASLVVWFAWPQHPGPDRSGPDSSRLGGLSELRLAQSRVAAGHFASAVEQLEALLARYPDYPDRLAALLLHGEALEGLGHLEEAVRAYQRVALEFPAERGEVRRRVAELAGRGALSEEIQSQLQGLGYL